ncbi:MAG: stage 0 sporulation family protein, partial [Desulfarculus sp.]|nr:stage 0 sporulation family protein [Desulfarculus sp.]
MGKVVGVRFQRGCKVYDFDSGAFVLQPGQHVIVQTEQGLALGQVVRGPLPQIEVELRPQDQELKQIHRLATPEDMVQQAQNDQLEREAHQYCQERIAARKLDMSLVKVEVFFDRSKMIFYFTAEGRLDFRELVRDLVAKFHTRVELRQIGVRHEAKLLGGLGSCGRELCCASFLKDFEPVSVKMAKEQNLSLNPTKISGLCGRLMCCLTYEYQTYLALKKDLPKVGKRLLLTPELEVKVLRQNVLERLVTVMMPDGKELTASPEELLEAALAHQAQAQAKPPRPSETGGESGRPSRGARRPTSPPPPLAPPAACPAPEAVQAAV